MRKIRNPKQLLQQLQDKVEQGVRSNPQEATLKPSILWARAITWSLIGTTGLSLAWLSLAQTEEIVVAPGKLEPIGSVKEVQMPIQGVAKSILVKDGDQVKAGQVLIRLDTEATAERQKNAVETIKLKRKELNLKKIELRRTEDLSNNRIDVLTKSLDVSNMILKSYEVLAKEGATARLQYLDQLNKVQQIQGDIENTRLDNRRQVSILQQNIQTINGELAELESKLTEANVTLRYQEIRSPVNGVVFELKPTGPGFVAQSSEPVMKIVPYDKLKARVEIESKDIGFVSTGKQADISIDSFPATDFGVLQGKVTSIGSDALPPDQAQNKPTYRYPANITLNSQQLKLKTGDQLPLQVGMSLTANIKLRKVTYLQLLLGEFKNKTDSLRRV